MTIAPDFAGALPTRPHRKPRLREPAWRRAWRLGQPLFRSRLCQFAVIGGLLFAMAPPARSPHDIDIRAERLAALHVAEAARQGSKALPTELARDVDQRALEDEILYREGVRLGLDKNDGIVRQRVVQKVLFLAEEMAGASRPADEGALRSFFAANQARWAIPEQCHFEQIYRHDQAELAAWALGHQTINPPQSEPSPVAAEIDGDRDRITTSFGAGFFDAIASAPVDRWSGPIRSAFGWHLVRVIEHRPARAAALGEVRPSVVEAFSVSRRQDAIADFLAGAFARYRVAIDGERLETFTPSRRVAFRTVASGED